MAFIRTKTHYNKRKPARVYLFLVKNYRSGHARTPRQATVLFLGRYKGETLEQLKERFPGLPNELERWFESRQARASESLREAEQGLRRSRKQLCSLRDVQ